MTDRLTDEQIALAEIRRIVATWPPLSSAARGEISALFAGDDQ